MAGRARGKPASDKPSVSDQEQQLGGRVGGDRFWREGNLGECARGQEQEEGRVEHAESSLALLRHAL